MKARLLYFPWTVTSLLLVAAAETVPVQAQTAPNGLVTITTNSPSVPIQAATAFVLQPVGIVKEVEKLTQSGTDPAVTKAFIESWQTPYSVSANDILHLHDLGVPTDTLVTLIQHASQVSAAVTTNPVVAANASVPYPAATAPTDQSWSASPPIPDQYAPQPAYPVEPGVDAYPAYPVYDSGYYYGYPGPYYYSGGVVVVGGYRGYPGYHGGYGGHGGSYGGHGGDGGGHGSSFSGHSGGVGGHGGGVGGHGGSSGGHGGGSGGHGGGGHR
jgi:hypothetical protein